MYLKCVVRLTYGRMELVSIYINEIWFDFSIEYVDFIPK